MLESLMALYSAVVQNWPMILSGLLTSVGALVIILNALIAVCLAIPGEQPEKALRAVVAWLEKFSRK